MLFVASTRLLFVYNFSEVESTFPALFWDYVAGGWKPCDMVSVCLQGSAILLFF